MGWIINTQEETRGKNKFDVKCKRIKFFPVEGKGGETHFKALGFVLLQIIVEDEKSGTLLKLKLNASKGVESPTFAITVAATTGVADADTGTPGANDVIINVLYK
jgi:hypothetical protein